MLLCASIKPLFVTVSSKPIPVVAVLAVRTVPLLMNAPEVDPARITTPRSPTTSIVFPASNVIEPVAAGSVKIDAPCTVLPETVMFPDITLPSAKVARALSPESVIDGNVVLPAMRILPIEPTLIGSIRVTLVKRLLPELPARIPVSDCQTPPVTSAAPNVISPSTSTSVATSKVIVPGPPNFTARDEYSALTEAFVSTVISAPEPLMTTSAPTPGTASPSQFSGSLQVALSPPPSQNVALVVVAATSTTSLPLPGGKLV